MTDLEKPWKIIYQPGGHLIAPKGAERVGDVSNVVFSNGWIKNEKDEIFIYYASSDTRLHLATTSVGQLVDYCKHTPMDRYTSRNSVLQRIDLIKKNKSIWAML